MGNIADSLKENLEHILKEVPEDLHEDAKKAVEEASDIVHLSTEEEIAAIKTELTENPNCDESVCGAIDENVVKAHQPLAPPTAAEQEAAQAEALKNPPAGGATE